MNKLGWNTRSVPDIFTKKWGWPLIKVTMKLPFPQKTFIEQQRREQWGDYRNPPPPPQTTVREFTDTGGPTARCQRKSQLSLSDKILIGVKSHKRPTTAERLAAWQLFTASYNTDTSTIQNRVSGSMARYTAGSLTLLAHYTAYAAVSLNVSLSCPCLHSHCTDTPSMIININRG